MLARLGGNQIKQHQKSGVRRGLIKDRNIIESEYGGIVPIGDIPFRTAAYSFTGQKFIWYCLVEVGQGRKFLSRGQSVACAFADKGEVSDSLHRRIRHQIV